MRKTKDVVCRKCGKLNRIPINGTVASKGANYCCTRRDKEGFRCCGNFKLAKPK